MRGIFAFLLLLFFADCHSQTLTSGGKLKPEQAIMDIRHYTIALNVDIPQKSISGYTTIDFILSQAAPTLLFDLMNDFQVQNIWVNGKPAPFTHANAIIRINPSAPVPAGKASVKIQYAGKPHVAIRPPWEDGFTWATDSTGHPWVAITAEGSGGKIYFPCKDHPSDEPNEGVDMIITVPKGLVVAGPGILQKVTKGKNTDTYFWKTNYTINNYSIIFNIGDYAVVSKTYTTVDGNKVPMQFYVLKYHASKAAHHLDILETMAKVKEKYFGEYPWAKEKIGIVETPHLGMEHQSMNAYGNNFKYTKVGGQDFDWLMNHEFGHEWWGNKVTAKDWADYWIHEGIGSFGDALYILDVEGEQAYIDHFKQTAFGIANEKPIVQGKDIDEETAYIGDIYSKGSFFMHTLRYIIGDSIFFPTLKELATAPQYTYDNLVNTDDVEQLFSKASGINLKPLFDFYLRTTQKLEVHVTAMRGDSYKIQLQNIDMALPLDIVTDKGTQRMTVDKKGIIIKSTLLPQVDTDMYYLKKIIIE
ncbi:MAG TPA: M1 family metallopeptidase [Chitinophagaceae bacterium]|nr:M1 family metallopeptidase [Chitinophagaceae bacterium]